MKMTVMMGNGRRWIPIACNHRDMVERHNFCYRDLGKFRIW